MIEKIRYILARKYIVNELAYFVHQYSNEIKLANRTNDRLVAERKLKTVLEIAKRFQIANKEIGLEDNVN